MYAFNYDLNGLGVWTGFTVYSPFKIPAYVLSLNFCLTGF